MKFKSETFERNFSKRSSVHADQCTISNIRHLYRPQRSCGQGNIFTPVCHSVHRGGVCLSACWDTTPPRSRHPLGADTPPASRHTPPGSRHTPLEQTPPWEQTPQEQTPTEQTPPFGQTPPPPRADTPPEQTLPPPREQTPAYGQREAGTHPTGMHSCLK